MNFKLIQFVLAVATVASLAGGHIAHAQDYPNRAIRLLTAEAGGGLDFQARLIAQGLAASFGRQVIVENRGGGAYAAETIAKSPPDGYNLLFYGSNVWLAPLLPVRSIKELVALAKARPGQLNYASGSTGSSPHLAAELFKYMAGVKIARINYRGNAQAYADVIRGEVPLIFPTSASAAPHMQSGKVRALAVTTLQRSTQFLQLPTVAEAGVPGYESASINGLLAVAGTPAAIIQRVQLEAGKVLNRTELKERLVGAGLEIVSSTPEDFATFIKSEMARMGKMIKAAGLRDE